MHALGGMGPPPLPLPSHCKPHTHLSPPPCSWAHYTPQPRGPEDLMQLSSCQDKVRSHTIHGRLRVYGSGTAVCFAPECRDRARKVGPSTLGSLGQRTAARRRAEPVGQNAAQRSARRSVGGPLPSSGTMRQAAHGKQLRAIATHASRNEKVTRYRINKLFGTRPGRRVAEHLGRIPPQLNL